MVAIPTASQTKRCPLLDGKCLASMRARQDMFNELPNYWLRLDDGREIRVVNVEVSTEDRWWVVYGRRTDDTLRRLEVAPPSQSERDLAHIHARLRGPHPTRSAKRRAS
jgi:hypothetical protein